MMATPPYTIVARIGKGGMAEVFKAIKQGPDGFEKTVALKKIIPLYTDHPQFIKMLSTEAKIHSQLDHANIVQLYDFFEFESQYMIAMEYIDGRNGKELIAACQQQSMTLPWQACVFIMIETLKALHYAHGKTNQDGPMQIVHRDVSPHNILISFDGRIKLSDFGIANAKIKEDKTKSGVLKGKYRYLSPEQVTAEEITHQTDLFASGVTLYELLTFVHPFAQEQEFELLKSIVQGNYAPIQTHAPGTPQALQEAVTIAMQPEPEDRFAHAKTFLDRLSNMQDPDWRNFGEERLANIMQQAFPAESRIETKLEPTKVLDASLATSSATSTLELTSPSQVFSRKKHAFVLILVGIIAIGALLFWQQQLKTKIHLSNAHVRTPSKASKPAKTLPIAAETETTATTKMLPKASTQPIKPKAKTKKLRAPTKAATKPNSTLGIITFSGVPGAEVFISGKKIGILPMKQYFLTPGSYLVLLAKGSRRTLQSISIKPGQSIHVEMQ